MLHNTRTNFVVKLNFRPHKATENHGSGGKPKQCKFIKPIFFYEISKNSLQMKEMEYGASNSDSTARTFECNHVVQTCHRLLKYNTIPLISDILLVLVPNKLLSQTLWDHFNNGKNITFDCFSSESKHL